ncbi:hypothetical protein CTRI78_v001650 [Colletotrichum trifolii]|uniref:DUF3074 domain-containing protein n=1 Tax=Colletotrichum trifolii TaxID=5466 RepID=A0A4R8RSE6_COLTR|nr:hypothetical protein CTRI78_v001650 [Colletotrichum trifolii]
MSPSHEPFKALAPVKWDDVAEEDHKAFLASIFADAQTIIDSIPVPAAIKQALTGRARSHTDPPQPVADLNRSLSQQRQSGANLGLSRDLAKEWKEVKLNARDNPLAINVYKLGGKDGKGNWFARRSVHDGLTFEKWKLGLEREFAESMKVQSGPGAGAIRGIGAEKRVVHEVIESTGKMEGPTAPRDFVTLLLTSDFSGNPPAQTGGKRPLRTFMIISKPCVHPECAERPGYIRGQYESVEIIREVPSDKPAITRAKSSIDFSQDSTKEREAVAESMGREAILRAARKAGDPDGGRQRGTSVDSAPPRDETGHGGDSTEEDGTTTIEWLMVTRSDPGGNVPRFLIDRGTPAGIVGDAGKFVKWVTAKSADDFAASDSDQEVTRAEAKQAEEEKAASPVEVAKQPTSNLVPDPSARDDEVPPSSNGLYGIISGAFELAGSAVASRLPNGLPGMFQAPSTNGSIAEEEKEDDADESDTSSICSFASAVEKTDEGEAVTPPDVTQPDAMSLNSSGSGAGSLHKTSSSHHEREFRKLQERRQKMQDKINRMQERMSSKRAEDSQRDATQLAKLREKHDKEVSKQEERYRRDLKKLEGRREQEQRKAEERRRKQAEKEAKSDLAMQLEHAKAERDVALKQVQMLKEQIGELQTQNTMLVAKMGRMGAGGLKREDSAMWSTSGEKAAPAPAPAPAPAVST